MTIFKRNIALILSAVMFFVSILGAKNIYADNNIENYFIASISDAYTADIPDDIDYDDAEILSTSYSIVESRPDPINFINGSFEYPELNDIFHHDIYRDWNYIPAENADEASKINGYVTGWNSRYLGEDQDFLEFENFIEIRNDARSYNSNTNKQYVELYSSRQTYLYQIFDTRPLSRLVYSYRYATRNLNNTRLAVSLGSDDEENRMIKVENAANSWNEASGSYIVPNGQYQTKIAFFSADNIRTDFSGIIIDDVDVKSGAYLDVKYGTDKDDKGFVVKDNIINSYIELTNYGQISASKVSVKEYLPKGVEYLGNIKVNGEAFTPDLVEVEDGSLYIEFGNTLEIEEGMSKVISYDIKLNSNFDSDILNLQAFANYNDKGFEYINPDGYNANSNISSLNILNVIGERDQQLVVIWQGISNAPEDIFAELRKDGIAVSRPAKLDLASGWKKTWVDAGSPLVGVWDVKILNNLCRIFSIEIKQILPGRWIALIKDKNGEDDSEYKEVSGSGENTTPEKEKKIDFDIAFIPDKPEEAVAEGESYNYTIILENKGDKDIEGIWIRCYVPDYTKYDSSDALSDYGCIDGKEHATWFIDSLAAKDSKELELTVTKDYCVAGPIEAKLFYEITGSKEKPYSNSRTNPNKVFTN